MYDFKGKVKINFSDWSFQLVQKAINEDLSAALTDCLKDDGLFSIHGGDSVSFCLPEWNDGDGDAPSWVVPIQSLVNDLDDMDMTRGSQDADYALELAANFRKWADEIEGKVK